MAAEIARIEGRDLEEREAKIRRLVDANIVGIFIWNVEGEKEYFRKDGIRVPVMIGGTAFERGGNEGSLSSSI